MKYQLNELEAFDAMRAFLHAYWERGLRSSNDIANLLSFMDRGTHPKNQPLWAVGRPLDIAQWDDWLSAVEKSKTNPENPSH